MRRICSLSISTEKRGYFGTCYSYLAAVVEVEGTIQAYGELLRVTVVIVITNWCLNQDASWSIITACVREHPRIELPFKMSDSPPDNNHRGQLMSPMTTGDTPPPPRDANALLLSYVTAGPRPRERTAPIVMHPRDKPRRGHSFLPPTPSFEVPTAGSYKNCNGNTTNRKRASSHPGSIRRAGVRSTCGLPVHHGSF